MAFKKNKLNKILKSDTNIDKETLLGLTQPTNDIKKDNF